MTIEEIATEVTVGIGVVVVVFCAGFIVVILLGLLFELAEWISRQWVFRALQCRVRGHGWISVTFGYFGERPYRRERTCGNCRRTEVLDPQ
jgi:hypothetical protein